METTVAAAAADDQLGPIAPSKKTADKIDLAIFIVLLSFPAADRAFAPLDRNPARKFPPAKTFFFSPLGKFLVRKPVVYMDIAADEDKRNRHLRQLGRATS
ncbi:MAG: hypothetical protein ACREO5_13570, partial [Candidatus Binatia bacterium]